MLLLEVGSNCRFQGWEVLGAEVINSPRVNFEVSERHYAAWSFSEEGNQSQFATTERIRHQDSVNGPRLDCLKRLGEVVQCHCS